MLNFQGDCRITKTIMLSQFYGNKGSKLTEKSAEMHSPQLTQTVRDYLPSEYGDQLYSIPPLEELKNMIIT